jgi:hypothetical protein
MDRRQGPIAASGRIVRIGAASLLALLCGGCAVGVATTSGFATLYNAVMFVGVASTADNVGPLPELDPKRRVLEQDCSKPVEDPSANLKCK